jgi:hypothetical protein
MFLDGSSNRTFGLAYDLMVHHDVVKLVCACFRQLDGIGTPTVVLHSLESLKRAATRRWIFGKREQACSEELEPTLLHSGDHG